MRKKKLVDFCYLKKKYGIR
ncbi:hypothetical protein E2C01_081758 [Portunus trituberculatus]|uniref:Uncharacterized protein n=1 Tax=Portunus trituberculatus TaxID=210409 RepID=A0A5B7IXC6_PORTR|nr:hypothetical protein [Portunus trituberculatus]